MHTVKIDTQKNRLCITLSGVLSLQEAIKVQSEIISSLDRLQPHFDVINDLSKYIHGDESAGTILQSVTRLFIDKKVKRVVRVVGPSKTGLMQFAKYSQLEEPINIKYLPTIEEAEEFLSDPATENT